ncbi:MAG: RagB/SusD family nutrient uptake outer membrane protein [Ferruginibacter sp.]|nr:RagB/SusD family nutrient uptake outer membrane protein [Ferruginibacter sp.]
MKKYINHSIIFLIAIAVCFSCKKYLDTTPLDVLVPSEYYGTEGEINAALGGVYSYLSHDGTFGRNLVLELEMGNDEAQYNNRNNNTLIPALYDCQSSTKIYSDCWTVLYRGINAANLLLTNIQTSPVADNIKNAAIGEATFLRGFYYFQLVTRYGDVPLILKPTTQVSNPNYPRTASSIVYDQIIKDMKDAEPLVKDIVAIGSGSRVSKTALQGIVARVYLKMAGRPLSLGTPAFDSARV